MKKYRIRCAYIGTRANYIVEKRFLVIFWKEILKCSYYPGPKAAHEALKEYISNNGQKYYYDSSGEKTGG